MKEELLNKRMAGLHLDDTDGSVLYSKGKRRQNNNSNNLKKHQNKNQNSPKKFKNKCHDCGSMVTNALNATSGGKTHNDNQTWQFWRRNRMLSQLLNV